MPRELSELTVGEQWAYRAKQTEPLTCVEVIRLGTGRPPRVQVKFVDDEFEGRQEWVPPGRLKVLWSGVDEWRENENRWAKLRKASECRPDSPEENALVMIFDYLPDWNLVDVHFRDDGIGRVHDVDALAADLDLEPRVITDDPVSLCENGTWFVPRRATEAIARQFARKYADAVIQEVEAEELKAQEQNRWGHYSGGDFIRAEICAEVDKEYAPARELIRDWCGVDARDRYDELVVLRAEVFRLGKLIERAISAVRSAGDAHNADALERELGIPLEVLRKAPEPDQGR